MIASTGMRKPPETAASCIWGMALAAVDEQLMRIDVESFRDLLEIIDRDVLLRSFDRTHIGPMHLCPMGELFLANV